MELIYTDRIENKQTQRKANMMKQVMMALALSITSTLAVANDMSDAKQWIIDNTGIHDDQKIKCDSKTEQFSQCRVHVYTGNVIDVYDIACTRNFGCVKTKEYTVYQ